MNNYFNNHINDIKKYYDGITGISFNKDNFINIINGNSNKYPQMILDVQIYSIVEEYKRNKAGYVIYKEHSHISESQYYNFEIVDKELAKQIKGEFNYNTSIRLSNHNRSSVYSNGIWCDPTGYLVDTSDKEVFKLSRKYLEDNLKRYVKGLITSDEFISNLNELHDAANIKEFLNKGEQK